MKIMQVRCVVSAIGLGLALSAAGATTAERHWTWCGWGGGGWFWCSAADPADADVFYMGGDVDGIWKTTDAGRDWRFVNRGLGNYAVYSLAVAPSDGRFVYALTKGGVAASTDGGANWTMCAETAPGALKILADRVGSVHAVAVASDDPKTVYAGGANGRLVKSTDGGRSWRTLVYAAPGENEPCRPVFSIAVSGADPNVVLLCQGGGGLYRSADAGANWTRVLDYSLHVRSVCWAGPKAPRTWYGAFDTNGVGISRDDGLTWSVLHSAANGRPARDVACSRQDPSVIHAVFTAGFASHVETSRDGGRTWTTASSFKADHAANPTLPGNGATGQLSGIENISVSPVDADKIHLPGNWNPCFSRDGGATWEESCRGADITCFHDLRFLGRDVYGAAMDEGSCRSTDGGATWTALAPRVWKAGLSGHHWRILPQRLADGRTRIIATVSPWDDRGIKYPVKVIVSEDGGATWTEAKGLPDYRPRVNTMWGEGHGRALAADPSNPDVIYVGIDGDPENGKCGGGVFKSTDGGRNFVQLASQPDSRRMFYGLAVDPTNPKRIVWGACGRAPGVYVSEDGGESWTKGAWTSDWMFNVEISPQGTIYAGGGQLWRSTDHGRTFRAVSKFSGGTVTGIAIDPRDENRIWVSLTTWDDNAAGGIFETRDGGKNWTDISGDIPYRKPLILRFNAETRELWAAGVAAFRTKVDD